MEEIPNHGRMGKSVRERTSGTSSEGCSVNRRGISHCRKHEVQASKEGKEREPRTLQGSKCTRLQSKHAGYHFDKQVDKGTPRLGGNLACFLMLYLGTYQRSGLQVLKATCESHRKRVHSTLSLGIGESECKAPRCTN